MDPTRWPLALFSRSAVQQHPSDVHQPYRRTRMNHSARLLIAATLIFAAGCAAAKQDWIDRTLVTVDVTGTWSGSVTGSGTIVMPGLGPVLLFELEQQGSTVKGYMRLGGSSGAASAWYRVDQGPVDGTVAGDVFRFRVTNGSLEGELKVSGDEMTGEVSLAGNRPLSLRRVDPSSPPGSPPR